MKKSWRNLQKTVHIRMPNDQKSWAQHDIFLNLTKIYDDVWPIFRANYTNCMLADLGILKLGNYIR